MAGYFKRTCRNRSLVRLIVLSDTPNMAYVSFGSASIVPITVNHILYLAEYAYGSMYEFCKANNVQPIYELEHFPISMRLSPVSESTRWLVGDILSNHLHTMRPAE